MALNAALVDLARRITPTPTGRRVEGTTQFVPLRSEWFKARLTLPAGLEGDDPQGGHRRDVRHPTLIAAFKDKAGQLTQISANDRLEVQSKALGTILFQVAGTPMPIRKKRRVIGYQVTMARVDEHPFTPTPDAHAVAP